MEHIIHALHGILQRALIAHITDVELDFAGHFRHTSLKIVADVVLFLFVTAKDADFTNVGAKESVKYRITKTAGTSCDKEGFVFEY